MKETGCACSARERQGPWWHITGRPGVGLYRKVRSLNSSSNFNLWGIQLEVFLTDLLSLFLTNTYTLQTLFQYISSWKTKGTRVIRVSCLEPLSAFLFSKQPEWVTSFYSSLPVPSTHPDPRALRLFGEKRCGRLKDGSISNRMSGLFYVYKAMTLPLHPQNSKALVSFAGWMLD